MTCSDIERSGRDQLAESILLSAIRAGYRMSGKQAVLAESIYAMADAMLSERDAKEDFDARLPTHEAIEEIVWRAFVEGIMTQQDSDEKLDPRKVWPMSTACRAVKGRKNDDVPERHK